MKKMMFLVYCRYRLDYHSHILYGPLLNGATVVSFEGSLRILIIVVLEVIENIKLHSFILRQLLFVFGKRKYRICTKHPIVA
jgi:hypothetical protein